MTASETPLTSVSAVPAMFSVRSCMALCTPRMSSCSSLTTLGSDSHAAHDWSMCTSPNTICTLTPSMASSDCTLATHSSQRCMARMGCSVVADTTPKRACPKLLYW